MKVKYFDMGGKSKSSSSSSTTNQQFTENNDFNLTDSYVVGNNSIVNVDALNQEAFFMNNERIFDTVLDSNNQALASSFDFAGNAIEDSNNLALLALEQGGIALESIQTNTDSFLSGLQNNEVQTTGALTDTQIQTVIGGVVAVGVIIAGYSALRTRS